MEQVIFNLKLDDLIKDIESVYAYDHKTLSDTVYDKIYAALDWNFQEFDDMDYSFKETNPIMLQVQISIIANDKVIQTIEFNV